MHRHRWHGRRHAVASMKAPPKRKGNEGSNHQDQAGDEASMKVPPKRKGNWWRYPTQQAHKGALNESPSQKEGKSQNIHQTHWVQEVPQ